MASRPKGHLRAWRVADSRHQIFDGGGAALYGGRWNSPGREVIYAAETYAGALLEILAHSHIGRVPRNFAYVEITVPESIGVEIVSPDDIPGWDLTGFSASQAFGDRWQKDQRSAVLLVPSVVTRMERNVLINPRLPQFAKIRVTVPQPVIWDGRLFSRLVRG